MLRHIGLFKLFRTKHVGVFWEHIIVHLDRRFVLYPGVAGVDEGAGVDDVEHEVPLQHRPLLHRYHSMRGSQPV